MPNVFENFVQIPKLDICQVRIDFETTSLIGPSSTSKCEEDTLSISGTAGEPPTVVCGELTGQHSQYLVFFIFFHYIFFRFLDILVNIYKHFFIEIEPRP